MREQYQIDITNASDDTFSHVYHFDRHVSNTWMDNQELRKLKVQTLIRECGSVKAFADKVGMQPGQASHLKNGVRNVGTAMARRIEVAFGKDRGWMDAPVPDGYPDGIHEDKYQVTAKDMDDLVEKLSVQIDSRSLLEFISKLTAELHKKSS